MEKKKPVSDPECIFKEMLIMTLICNTKTKAYAPMRKTHFPDKLNRVGAASCIRMNKQLLLND